MSQTRHYWPDMDRGTESEANVMLTLKRLHREGLIDGFSPSAGGDRDDRRGVDFRVYLRSSAGVRLEIPLQVKSSARGMRDHREKAATFKTQRIAVVNGQSQTIHADILRALKPFMDRLAERQTRRVVPSGQLRLDFGGPTS